METNVKKKFSLGKKQKCSLVKDGPWGNFDTNSNYAIMKNAANSNLTSSAKLNFGGKKTNAVLYYPMQSTKIPMLDSDVDNSPNALLAVPVRRGRPQKLKFSEFGQHLKNIRRSSRTSQQVPLETDVTCSEVVFDIEDVDGVFFASFSSKEVLDSYAVDDCGERQEMQSVQISLPTPYDSDFQVRLRLLESDLLEDLKYFRHRQVIHPSLQEVGLKLGSVDPGRSIDLKYLGVHLPLNLSKDYEFGASSTDSQDTGFSFISRTGKTDDFRKIKGWQGKFYNASGQEDIGLSFISRTGKTDDFRKIKGWQGKFHSASWQEDIISKGSLKNQSAFYSDKLDKYLENEGKLIETSLELSTNASNSSVLCQLPSKNSSCIEKNQVLLHKTFSIPPPSSYTFKPFSMPSVFRKKKRKTKNRKTKRKRATSRGRAKSFNNLAVPASILSKEKYAFPDDEIIKLQSELGGNVWERPRTEQQTQQTIHAPSLSKEKLMDLVLEYCMLRNRKLPTHVTDEHGKPSLATHFISQDYDIELPEKPCGTVSNIGGSNADIPSPGMSVNLVKTEGCSHFPSVYPVAKLPSQILASRTKLPLPDTHAATIFPPELISMSQAIDWFPKVSPAGMSLAQMACSESNLTYCSNQQLNSPTSLAPLQFGSFALHQLPKQQIAHHTLHHIVSRQGASNLVSINHTEELGTIIPEEGKLSHLQKVVVKSEVPESDTMPKESELMVNTTDRFEALTSMMWHGKSMVAAATPPQHTYALELSSEALCMYPDIPSAVPLSDHSYVSKKLNSEMLEKKQHAWYFEDSLDKVSEDSWQTKHLKSNVFLESLTHQKEAAQLKSLGVGQAYSTQMQRLGFDLEGPEQPQIKSFPDHFPLRWEVQDNFELLVRHKNERDDPLKLEGDREDGRREAKATCAKEQNCAAGMEYVYSAQECLYKMNTGFQKNCNASNYNEIIAGIQGEKQTVKDNLAPASRFWSKLPSWSVAMCLEEKSPKTTHCKNGFMPITNVTMDDNKMDDSTKELISGISGYRIENVETLVKNTNQKADFIALGIEEKTSRLHKAEAMLLEVPMSCSESEKNERKFHSGAVPCIRDAATLEMDEKNAETMEKLSSDAPIFYPEVVLSDHTYVTKVKAEKEQHMILPEDIPDSISLLTSKPNGSVTGSLENIQQAPISSDKFPVFSLDTMKRLLIRNSSSSEQSEVPCSSEKKGGMKRKVKCRKYDESYLDYGFTCVEVNNEERPQCVICLKVLAAESMRPNKLKRHLESLHPNGVGKPREFFISKLKEAKPQQTTVTKQTKVNANALLSSYKMAFHIAQCRKPHTTAEELVLPAAVDMVTTMLGEEAGKQLLKIPLSNNTISRRIDDMAEDIHDQLIGSLRGKEFALQLGEATDNHKDTHLICYVRFVNEKKFVEDLLFCKEMKGGTTGEHVFEIVDDFMAQNQIDWEKCVGVCTDGGRSVAGCYQGLQTCIQSRAPHAIWTHCIIHRAALAAENLSGELHEILKTVIKVVNFIKAKPMKTIFFAKMCDGMGAERSCLSFYSSSHWLSLGNSLLKLYELRNEIYSYLHEEEHCLADKFIDSDFVIQLAFLSDLFEKLNALNKSLQGSNTNILQLLDKVTALKKKVILWESSVSKGDYKCFPSLDQYLQTNEMTLKEELRVVFVQYLSQLHLYLQKYFPKDEVEPMQWVRDPFNSEIPSRFNIKEAEQLIDVSTDSILKMRFQSQSLPEFWCQTEDEYPVISRRALRIFIPFATTYLCETGFSAVAEIKSKYRSKINLEKEMRVAISKITPRFKELCKEKQAQPSH